MLKCFFLSDSFGNLLSHFPDYP